MIVVDHVQFLVREDVAVPVHGDDLHGHRLPGLADVLIGPHADVELALMDDDRRPPGDLLTVDVGDRRFDGIELRHARIREVSLDLEGGLALRVRLSILLGDQFPERAIHRPGCARRVVVVVEVVVALPGVVEDVVRGQHRPVHVGVRHRAAEEETRVHRYGEGRALHGLGDGRGHIHLKLRLAILRDAERDAIVGDVGLRVGEVDIVVAQPGLVRQLELAGERAEPRERERVAIDLLALIVVDRDVDRAEIGEAEARIVLFPQHALEVDHLAGPVDGPVSIEIGREVLGIELRTDVEVPRVNTG